MYAGGKKVVKPQRTKLKRYEDGETQKVAKKQKHHDRSYYRLVKEEKEYVV